MSVKMLFKNNLKWLFPTDTLAGIYLVIKNLKISFKKNWHNWVDYFNSFFCKASPSSLLKFILKFAIRKVWLDILINHAYYYTIILSNITCYSQISVTLKITSFEYASQHLIENLWYPLPVLNFCANIGWFWVILAGYGWLQVALGGNGFFWLVLDGLVCCAWFGMIMESFDCLHIL